MSQQKVRSIKQKLKEEKSFDKNITKMATYIHSIMTKITEKYEKNQQDTMQCNGTLKEAIATNDSFIRPIQWVPLGVWWENE